MNKINSVPTFTATIYIAGEVADAKRICRTFCNEVGFCVTVSKTEYVYTGGAESGIVVGCINYPRFPSEPDCIREKAVRLARALLIGLQQQSFTIVMTDETIWYSERAE